MNRHLSNDAQLWREFTSGCDEALAAIYNQYAAKLYNYGRQFTFKSELVRDCIQDLFCELIQNRGNLGDTTSIKYYLLACIRNKLMRAIRKDEKYAQLQVVEYEMSGFHIGFLVQNDAFSELFALETKQTLEKAFNQIPAKQREALMLHFYEGMSYQQITDIMQIGKVKSTRCLIYRAIESMSAILQNSKRQSELV